MLFTLRLSRITKYGTCSVSYTHLELENCLERSAIMSANGVIAQDVIELSGLSPRGASAVLPSLASKLDLDDPDLDERERVIAALEQAGWVQALSLIHIYLIAAARDLLERRGAQGDPALRHALRQATTAGQDALDLSLIHI